MRTTRLLTWNNTRVIIPNETVINQVLVNHSSNGRIRIEVPMTVPAKGDVSAARKAIVEKVRTVEGVMDDPPPDVVVNSVSSASIDLLIYAWVANAGQELPVRYKVMEASKPLLNPTEQ
jgi:small conductance mechanosensitive channel